MAISIVNLLNNKSYNSSRSKSKPSNDSETFDQWILSLEELKREKAKQMFFRAKQIEGLIHGIQNCNNDEGKMLGLFVEYSTRFGYINEKQFEFAAKEQINFLKVIYNTWLYNNKDCSARFTTGWNKPNWNKLKLKSKKEKEQELRIEKTIKSFVERTNNNK